MTTWDENGSKHTQMRNHLINWPRKLDDSNRFSEMVLRNWLFNRCTHQMIDSK